MTYPLGLSFLTFSKGTPVYKVEITELSRGEHSPCASAVMTYVLYRIIRFVFENSGSQRVVLTQVALVFLLTCKKSSQAPLN